MHRQMVEGMLTACSNGRECVYPWIKRGIASCMVELRTGSGIEDYECVPVGRGALHGSSPSFCNLVPRDSSSGHLDSTTPAHFLGRASRTHRPGQRKRWVGEVEGRRPPSWDGAEVTWHAANPAACLHWTTNSPAKGIMTNPLKGRS